MNKLILIIFSGIIFSCSNQSTSTQTAEENFIPKSFFDFTEVDHYSINISENEIWSLEEIDSGQTNYLFNEILTNLYPENIKDTAFIQDLESFGYTKSKISNAKHVELDSLFSEKKHEEFYQYMCLPEFRDLLIFKDSVRIVGIAKICFSCDESHILGANANTEKFGMSGDYRRLWNLLYEKKAQIKK